MPKGGVAGDAELKNEASQAKGADMLLATPGRNSHSSYPMAKLIEDLKDIIRGFDEQEEMFGDSFSLYGVGARDAYKHILDMIQSSPTKTSEENEA